MIKYFYIRYSAFMIRYYPFTFSNLKPNFAPCQVTAILTTIMITTTRMVLVITITNNPNSII